MSAPTLTVIGLDAATFDVIDPLVELGELPNIGRLIQTGSRGILRSTTHPLTPLAWTTMVTGVNAGRHGIWDFVDRDASGHHVRLANGSFRQAPAVWDHLASSGRSVGLVNIPFTWPAPEVNGFAISGLDASSRADRAVYPASLGDEIRERFGAVAVDHSFPLDDRGRVDLDQVRRVCAQRVEIVQWLAERFDPALLFAVFMSADHIHHIAWPDWDENGPESVVADVYRILDTAVGALAEIGGGMRDILIVSDHGGGSLEGVINLNAWLASERMLAWSDRKAGAQRDLGRRLVSGAYQTQRTLPRAVRRRLKQLAPRMRDRALELREISAVDWSRTTAFAYGAFGNIVVNVRGRERHGIVEPGAAYEAVRDEVAAAALRLESPNGTRIVAAAHRREDLYEGPALERLPDLIVEFTDYAWLGKAPLDLPSNEIWTDIRVGPAGCAPYVGSHRHEGIIVAAGPSCPAGIRLDASLEDICPTILHLLGEPVPENLLGRPLVEVHDRQLAFTTGASSAAPHQNPSLYENGAEAEVEARLRSLGYLE